MTANVIAHGAVVAKRYKMTDRLGSTAMAQVWKAADLAAGGAVAVKFQVLSDEVLSRSDAMEIQAELAARFHQEAGLLGELDHPGIPRFHAEGTYRGLPYFVMEFIDGVALHELHGKYRPLPLAAIAAIAVRSCQTLLHAHARPVVHRDLKPPNIMITKGGVLKVIDFGIAKDLAVGAVGLTRPGATLGSIGYQAPEQIEGRSVTPATDVYALGCVLYELFALHPPFPDKEVAAVQRRHLLDEPCPLAAITNRITPELDDVIVRMLAKAPERRPSLAEVVSEFEPCLPKPGDPAPLPTLDPDPTLPYRFPDLSADVRGDARQAVRISAPATRRGSSAWLSVRELTAACDLAEAEVAAGVYGPAVRHLIGLAPRARREMGSTKPAVIRALEIVARAQLLPASGDANAPDASPPPEPAS
jgi:eukaryotic-like serine/threonine-protein kinase